MAEMAAPVLIHIATKQPANVEKVLEDLKQLLKNDGDKIASARLGSVSSRNHALLYISHICETFGIKPNELPGWIFTARAGDELMQLLNVNFAEAKADYSYFPRKYLYCNLLFFLHLTGTLLGSLMSKQARQTTECNLENNTINAVIFAYALKQRETQTQKAYTVDEDKLEVEPKTIGIEWYKYMARRKFVLTKEMREFVVKVQGSLGVTKKETIGRYIQNYVVI